jgi:hypothetical protein
MRGLEKQVEAAQGRIRRGKAAVVRVEKDSDRGGSFSSDESGDQVLDLSRLPNRGLRSTKDQIINSKVRDEGGAI